MGDDDGPTPEELEGELNRLKVQFQKLAENYNDLRYELNEVEQKLERRT